MLTRTSIYIIMRVALTVFLLTSAHLSHAVEYDIVDLGPGYAPALNEKGDAISVSPTLLTYYFDGLVRKSLGTLGTGTVAGTDLNNYGEVVGIYRPAGSPYDTSVAYYDGQTWTLIGKFGAQTASSSGINDSGVISGTYYPAGSGNCAFIYNLNTRAFKGLPSYSHSWSINSRGWISGTSNKTGVMHAYYYDGSALHDIAPLGGPTKYGYGYGINANGHVVGMSNDAFYHYHAFLYNGLTAQDLGTLGGTMSQAYAVNNFDEVVGYSKNISGQDRAFLHDGSGMIDLNGLVRNKPGWVLTSARDINDNGMIVGVGTYNGIQHGFLLTPVVDLQLSASRTQPYFHEGQPAAVTFTVTNAGSSAAPTVSLRVPIPAGLSLISAAPTSDCDLEDNEVWCNFQKIDANSSKQVVITFTPLSVSQYTFSGSVNSRGSELTQENNAATFTFGVNGTPRISIDSPVDGAVFNEGTPVLLHGTATDLEDGDLSRAISWYSSISGYLGSGDTCSVGLVPGTHLITARVTDSAGATAAATRSSIFINALPDLKLLAPDSAGIFTVDSAVTFSATATDREDGEISNTVTWTSSLDGELGVGSQISRLLSLGIHTITANVSDSQGSRKEATTQIRVDPIPQIKLQATANGKGTSKSAVLNWTGARTTVDIFQNGILAGSGPANGTASFPYKNKETFKVCESHSHYCSDIVMMTKRQNE